MAPLNTTYSIAECHCKTNQIFLFITWITHIIGPTEIGWKYSSSSSCMQVFKYQQLNESTQMTVNKEPTWLMQPNSYHIAQVGTLTLNRICAPPQCNYLFHIILTVKNNHSPKQHHLFNLCNEHCFFCWKIRTQLLNTMHTDFRILRINYPSFPQPVQLHSITLLLPASDQALAILCTHNPRNLEKNIQSQVWYVGISR